MKPVYTDDEFIKLFTECGGMRQLAIITGLNLRSLHKRRRNIELRYGIAILPTHNKGSVVREKVSVINKISEGIIHTTVKNGIVIIFSDAHFYPNVKTTAFRALVALIKQLKPVMVINNGDAFDGGGISRYPRIGWDNKPTVKQELDAVTEALDAIEKAASVGCELLWPLGNHDARFETFLAARAPEFQGVGGFHLKDHFPRWRPCWLININNDVAVKHRYKGGVHATHNNTVNAGKTIVTGHLHSLKVTPFSDYTGNRFGVDSGTLADPSGEHDRDYTEQNPLNHRSGFIVLTFKDGKLLMPEIVMTWGENEVCFRGHLLDADSGELK